MNSPRRSKYEKQDRTAAFKTSATSTGLPRRWRPRNASIQKGARIRSQLPGCSRPSFKGRWRQRLQEKWSRSIASIGSPGTWPWGCPETTSPWRPRCKWTMRANRPTEAYESLRVAVRRASFSATCEAKEACSAAPVPTPSLKQSSWGPAQARSSCHHQTSKSFSSPSASGHQTALPRETRPWKKASTLSNASEGHSSWIIHPKHSTCSPAGRVSTRMPAGAV